MLCWADAVLYAPPAIQLLPLRELDCEEAVWIEASNEALRAEAR
ncbi:hypothetical protein ACNSZF_22570 [Burkholderia gladioli]